MDAKLKEQARTRLAQMKQAAEDLTEALGLPREATYDVLAMMYGEKPSPLGIPQRAAQLETSEDTLKTRILQLSEGFLGTQMKTQLSTLHTIWESVKTLPLETLAKLGQLPGVSQGLSFAGENQQAYQVVSVISWAVLNQPTFQANTSDEIETIIVREAKARGCSLALSHALALYLRPHLMNN